jgi:hypothetical protein
MLGLEQWERDEKRWEGWRWWRNWSCGWPWFRSTWLGRLVGGRTCCQSTESSTVTSHRNLRFEALPLCQYGGQGPGRYAHQPQQTSHPHTAPQSPSTANQHARTICQKDLTRAEHSPRAARLRPQLLNDQFRPPVDLYAHSSLCIVQGSKNKCLVASVNRRTLHFALPPVPSLSQRDSLPACLLACAQLPNTHTESPSAPAGSNVVIGR